MLSAAAEEPSPAARIFDSLTLDQGKSATFSFTAIPAAEDRVVCLEFKARLATERVAGFTNALRIKINGVPLKIERALGRPERIQSRNGAMYSMAAGDILSVFYSPDFDAPDADAHYGLTGGIAACRFSLQVGDLLRNGANELTIENATPASVVAPLVVAEGALALRPLPPPPKPKAGPPEGELPVYAPRTAPVVFTAVAADNGAINVTVAGQTFAVASRFSTPAPAWVTGANDYFAFSRALEVTDDAVLVRDTFRNLTNAPLGIMQRHEVAFGAALKTAWCAGLEQYNGTGQSTQADNPTTFACNETAGLGLLAVGDVFRIHAANYAGDGTIGLADNQLVLPPGGDYTVEWAIVPVDTPDYWTFINAARRVMNANFTVDGGFCFFRSGPPTDAWSDEQTVNFLRFKDVKYACDSIAYPLYKGLYTHGTSFQRINRDNYRAAVVRRHALAPEVKDLVYFHCYLDVTEDGPERFPDARVLVADGTQADYGEAAYRIYFPTETNSYGPEIAKNVNLILGEIGADGVYWDEHEYSRFEYHFGEPWDGVSGDVDRDKMTVSRTKSSVTLLTEPWRLALAKSILARGALIGNGAPTTRAMAALHFPCFVETGSITNCARAHLHSPIALGDHLTERCEDDAYKVMRAALDYGCVYHWYNDVTVIPTHHHLTQYMYPITPIELHAGYIIGRERIVTNRSGLFGWGDNAEHEVHVFDAAGREVPGYAAPRVVRDGAARTELRLAEDWTAAIVRK